MPSGRQPRAHGAAGSPATPSPQRLPRACDINPAEEVVTTLLELPGVRVERIVSLDYVSPADFWYDQDCHEWVLVVAGCGEVEFEDGRRVRLHPGDSLDLPAHCKHRVSYTDPDSATIWVAVRIGGDLGSPV